MRVNMCMCGGCEHLYHSLFDLSYYCMHWVLTKIQKCSTLYWFLQASITRYSGWQIAFTLWGKPFIFWMTCTTEYLVLYAFQKHATAEQSNVHQDIPHYGTEPPFKWHQQQDVFMCNIQWNLLHLIHFSVLVSHCLSVFKFFFSPWQKNGYGRNSISLENRGTPLLQYC